MNAPSLRLRPLALLAATLLVPATGCAIEDAGFIDDDAEIESRDDWGCVTCGVNDAFVNFEPLRDLDRGGLPNEGGVILDEFHDPNGVPYILGTRNDELVALSTSHTIVAQGDNLIGWKLQLDTPHGPETVKITSYDRNISSWKANGTAMSAYGLAYLLDGTIETWKNVCPDHADSPSDAAVTILAGETYDNDLKLVNPNTGTWISFACRDQAAWKMKRLSYGPHGDLVSNNPLTPATLDQRQSTLKMLTADYCGTGHSFTVTGTQIYWRNFANTVVHLPLMYKFTTQVEALWDADGAICLTKPRLVTLADVAAECDIPVCTQAMVDAGNWEWVTRVDL